MLSGMGQTCYVRYPDADKDDPRKPGEPNRVVEISSHKLDDYRAEGYVQCNADGTRVAKPIPRVETHPKGGYASLDDDPVAAAIQDEADPAPEAPTPPAPAPASGGKG